MRLPEDLRESIERELASFDRRELARASVELTERYKSAAGPTPLMGDPAHRAAYLSARLPATYAAAQRVFSEIRKLAPQLETSSMLDLGAGPGTALWAAAELIPELKEVTAVEADAAWTAIGKRLAAHARPAVRQAQWIQHDLRTARDWPAHDLVVISYALGELPHAAAESLLQKAWRTANKFLVVIEPGTMRGFNVIHQARTAMIAAGAGILAPCPHLLACPMAAAADWCHFSARVERSSLHRQTKGAALGYEDEKFSYLVASKDPGTPPVAARILRHPQKHSGHVQLKLCTPRGMEKRTITRSQKALYKAARQAEWGETWID